MEDKAAVGHCTWSCGWWGAVWSWACLIFDFRFRNREGVNPVAVGKGGGAGRHTRGGLPRRTAQIQRISCRASKFQKSDIQIDD